MQPDRDRRRLQLDFERITVAHENFATNLLGWTVAVILLSVIVGELSSPLAAVIWAAVVIATYIPRIIVSVTIQRGAKRKQITPERVTRWERYALLTSIVPYVSFAAVVFLPYGEHIQIALFACAFFTLVLIAGGTLTYSTSIGILLLFLNVTLISLIARSLWEHGTLLDVLAATLIIAYVMLTRMIFRLNRVMVDGIAMRLDSAHQALVDPLTSLWNRRRMKLFVDMLIPATRRSGRPFCLILMDLDHFKRYNDAHGHQAGDELLVAIAKIIRSCTREQDLVVRWGGEEFVVVLPDTTRDDARHVAERILTEVRDSTDVTISAGLDEYEEGVDVDEMVRRADTALYAAKEAGRDRLKIA